MDKITETRINKLHPLIRKEVFELIEEANKALAKGVIVRVTQGLRTKEEQDNLYSQGRTKPGPIITRAKFLQSFHNYGLALDFVILIDKDGNGTFESASWKVDSDWMTVINIFKKHGYKSGADFKSFKDYPHLEKTFGYTWQQMKAIYNAGKFDSEGYIIL